MRKKNTTRIQAENIVYCANGGGGEIVCSKRKVIHQTLGLKSYGNVDDRRLTVCLFFL